MRGTRSPASALLAACVLAGALAGAPAASAQSRGELLYATHRIACLTTQAHWRDKKLVTDWNSLKLQVRRWQAVAALDWSEEDVLDVTWHLNDSFYGFTPASNTFVSMRLARNATLDVPTLILPSIKVNVRAGELPHAEDNGVAYLRIPLNPLPIHR